MLKKSLVLAACLVPVLTGSAWSQANIVPDMTPRLPPQPGQGLPLEDRQYLERARGLSAVQVEMGRLATEKAASEDVKQFGGRIATDHERIGQELTGLAQARRADVAARPPGDWWRQRLERLRGAAGEPFERDFLDLQLGIQKQMVELYQTQASHSTDIELARFAITRMVTLQQQFQTAQQLGSRYGLSVDVVEQPPQY